MMRVGILYGLASLSNVAFCTEDVVDALQKPKVAMNLREDSPTEVAEQKGRAAARAFASLRTGRRLRQVEDKGKQVAVQPKKGALAKLKGMDPKVAGKLALFCVPVLWGTATPVLRFIYNFPNSPNPAELSAIRCIIAVVALIGPTLKKMQSKRGSKKPTTVRDILAGLEIGMWAGLGQGLQAFGVKHTTAAKAGFILTTINVLVPALAFVRGKKVPIVTWCACVVAMAGVVVMSKIWSGLGSMGLTYGDASVLAGAIMYSWVTVRTSELAPGRDSTMLTCLKKVMMSVGSITWDIVQACVRHVGMFSSGLWTAKGATTAAVIEAWAALLWSALVPGTLAAVLQIYAQSHVSAAESQLVYATAPVFNTIISAVFLHEKLNGCVLGGGAILIFASLMPHLWPLLLAIIKKSQKKKLMEEIDEPHARSSLR